MIKPRTEIALQILNGMLSNRIPDTRDHEQFCKNAFNIADCFIKENEKIVNYKKFNKPLTFSDFEDFVRKGCR